MAEQDDAIKEETAKSAKSTLSLEDARDVLGRLVLRAGFGNERIELTYHGEPTAALVGMKDLARLREMDAAETVAA